MRVAMFGLMLAGCLSPFPTFQAAGDRGALDAAPDGARLDAQVDATEGARSPTPDLETDEPDRPELADATVDATVDATPDMVVDMAPPPPPILHPLISEWVLDNTGELLDEDGDPSGWIELYNPYDVPLAAADFGLAQGMEGDPWGLPDVALGPHAFRVIFLSGKNRRGAEWHTDFRIESGARGSLRLTTAAGSTVFSAFIPQLEPGEAFGYPREPVTTPATAVRYDTRAEVDANWREPAYDADDWPMGGQPIGADLIDASAVLGPFFGALVADWRFDEPAAPDVTDRTGSHPGVLRNSQVAPGTGIDGTGALNNVGAGRMLAGDPRGFDFDAAFTWSFWFRGTDGRGILIGRSPLEGPWNRGSKAVFVRNGLLQWDTGWVGNPRTNIDVTDDVWRHVAIRFEPGDDQLQIFVDGAVAYEGRHDVNRFDESRVDQGGAADSALFIGGGVDSIVTTYEGSFDAVSIWDQALPVDAIQALALGAYPGPPPRYGDRLVTALPGGTPGARIRLRLPPHQMIGLQLSGLAQGAADLWADGMPLPELDGEGTLPLQRETRVVAARAAEADGAWILQLSIDGLVDSPTVLARPTPGAFNAPAR